MYAAQIWWSFDLSAYPDHFKDGISRRYYAAYNLALNSTVSRD